MSGQKKPHSKRESDHHYTVFHGSYPRARASATGPMRLHGMRRRMMAHCLRVAVALAAALAAQAAALAAQAASIVAQAAALATAGYALRRDLGVWTRE